MKKFIKKLGTFIMSLFKADAKVSLITPSRKWTIDEETVAAYCLLHNVENIGMSIGEVATAVDRTEGAFRTKMSRLGRMDVNECITMRQMIRLNEFGGCKEFFKALIRISAESQNGMAEAFKLRLKQEIKY